MSLDFRRDNRTVGQFARDIDLETAKQRVWAEVLQVFYEEKTGKPCRKEDYGVDNDGKLIEGGLLNNNVDNIFWIADKEVKVEIKTIPEYLEKFMTFKVSSLRACIDQKANIVVPKRNHFYHYYTRTCEYLLDNFSSRIYEKFSPNDKAIRIFKNDIDELIEKKMILLKDWGKRSQFMIETNWQLLSRD